MAGARSVCSTSHEELASTGGIKPGSETVGECASAVRQASTKPRQYIHTASRFEVSRTAAMASNPCAEP